VQQEAPRSCRCCISAPLLGLASKHLEPCVVFAVRPAASLTWMNIVAFKGTPT
jgi:hypothetical protein